MGIKYYDREGKPIVAETDQETVLKWARMYEDTEYRLVKQTGLDEASNSYVSTIWIGFDLDPFVGHAGPGLIFETALFLNGEIEDVIRHATEADAIEGHDKMVAAQVKPDLL